MRTAGCRVELAAAAAALQLRKLQVLVDDVLRRVDVHLAIREEQRRLLADRVAVEADARLRAATAIRAPRT